MLVDMINILGKERGLEIIHQALKKSGHRKEFAALYKRKRLKPDLAA